VTTQPALSLFDNTTSPANGPTNPLPMQYLGSKARIAKWIIAQIHNKFPNLTSLVDLFAGTGSVSLLAKEQGYKLHINDIQPYAAVVLKSIFREHRDGLNEIVTELKMLKEDEFLLASGRCDAEKLLREEREHFVLSKHHQWAWEEYRDFCESTHLVGGNQAEVDKLKEKNNWNLFAKYYSNTYFGVEQCLQIDALREYAEKLPNESARIHVIAATISAMTYAVSSTTHLAQYLKPSSRPRSIRLVKRRSLCLVDQVINRLRKLISFPLPEEKAVVYREDFRKSLSFLPMDDRTVVYVDPPYFKEHYSRYYHILDTFYLYDYPALTYNNRLGQTTVGRYRDNRIVSDFGLKGSVQKAFFDLFTSIKTCGAKVALSYANTSLVAKKDLLRLARKAGLKGEARQIQLMHSGQGQPRNKIVTEFLFLLEP